MTNDQINEAQSLVFAGEILTTPDLVLRSPTLEDVPEITVLANNRKISSMLESLPYPYYDKHAEEFILQVSRPDAGECVFAITHAETGRLMGMCGLHLVKRRFNMAHMGYWLGEDYWGRGYATQAARALVDLFFKAGTEDVLLMSVLASNTASRRVIEKCGGRFWKRESNYSSFFEKEMDVDHFRITRENWMGAIAA
ncbi:MAG: GNAT family N-acetyltransferase [Pseudomonadota bacterium]